MCALGQDEVVVGLEGVGAVSAVSHPGQTDICRPGDVGNGAHAEKLAVGFRCDVVLDRSADRAVGPGSEISGHERGLPTLAGKLGVRADPAGGSPEARTERAQ